MRKNEPNASKHCVIVRISALFPYSTCPVTVNMRNSFVVCAPLSVKPVQHIAKCSKTLTARSVQECAENVQRSAVIWRVKTKQGGEALPCFVMFSFSPLFVFPYGNGISNTHQYFQLPMRPNRKIRPCEQPHFYSYNCLVPKSCNC